MSSAAKLRKYGRGTATVAAAALVMTSFGPAAFAAWDVAPQNISNLPTGVSDLLTQVSGEGGEGGANDLATAQGDGTLQDDGTIGIADTSPGRVAGDQDIPGSGIDTLATLNENPAGPEDQDENQGARLVQAGQNDQSVADIWITVPNRFKSGDILDLRLLDRSATENADGTSNSGPSTLVGFSEVPTVEVFGPQNAGEVVHPDTDNASATNIEAELNNAWSPAGVSPSDVRNVAPSTKPVFTSSISQTNGVQGNDNLRLRLSGDPSTGDPTAMWVVKISNVKVNLGANVTPGELRVVPFASSKFDNQDAYYATPWFMGNHKNGAVDYTGAPINVAPTTNSGRQINTYTVPAYVAPVTVSSSNTDIVADGNPQRIGALTLNETKPYALASGQYRLYVDGAVIRSDAAGIKATLTGGDAGESVSNVTVNADDGYIQFTYTAVTTDPKTPASIAIEGLLLSTSNASQIKYRFAGAALENTWLAPAGYSDAVAGGVSASTAFVTGSPSDEWNASDSEIAGRNSLSASPAGLAPTIATTTSGVLPAGTYQITAGTNAGVKITNGSTLTIDNVTPGTPFTVQTATAANAGYATGTAAAGLAAEPEAFTLSNLRVGESFTVGANNIDNAVSSVVFTNPASVTGAANLPAGTYIVAANAGTTANDDFTLTGPSGLVLGNSAVAGASGANVIRNGAVYTTATGNYTAGGGVTDGLSFTFNGLVDGMTLTILANDTTVPAGANQKDILAPLDELMQAGVATAPSARIGGNNRYETAAKVAEAWALGDKSIINGKFRNAIIASGENFPDALSASYLSQRMGAPILLTQAGRLPQDTVEALRDRQVEKVFIVGGTAAISQAVEDQLKGLDTYYLDDRSSNQTIRTTGAKLQTQRLAGGSRYTTNQLVNMYAAAWGGVNTIGKTVYKYGEAGKYTAIVARGDNFPDALAAGVLTAGVKPVTGAPHRNDGALPLILTLPGELSSSAKDQIDNLDVEHALIVGGKAAVSDAAEKGLTEKGLTVNRLSRGADAPELDDRYGTAAAVAEFAMRTNVASTTNEYPGLGFLRSYNSDGTAVNANVAEVFLANGLKFPDALTAAPWIGLNSDVLALTAGTNDLSNGTKDLLTKRSGDLLRAVGLGLGQAVSNGILNEANKIVSVK